MANERTQVEVGEVASTVHVTDSNLPLSPQVLEKIVRLVLERVEEREAHRERVRGERRVGSGVSHELEGEDDR